jgi:predicted ABC-type ATPase
MKRPQLVMLAGPNGAGKSTFYDAHLADSPLRYLNADLVAARAGIDSVEAARLLDAWRSELVEAREGFITETVFSDPVGAKLDLLRRAVAADFEVTLIYIGLEPRLAGLRIDQRVASGGHDVPRDRLGPRFGRSLKNLVAALDLVPTVLVYDNSSTEGPHRLIARFESGQRTFLGDGPVPRWAQAIVSR